MMPHEVGMAKQAKLLGKFAAGVRRQEVTFKVSLTKGIKFNLSCNEEFPVLLKESCSEGFDLELWNSVDKS